jgi:hypothetical protein
MGQHRVTQEQHLMLCMLLPVPPLFQCRNHRTGGHPRVTGQHGPQDGTLDHRAVCRARCPSPSPRPGRRQVKDQGGQVDDRRMYMHETQEALSQLSQPCGSKV